MLSLGGEGEDVGTAGSSMSCFDLESAFASSVLDLMTSWSTTACRTSAGKSSFGDSPKELSRS